jgi:hypothetical protein
MGRYRKSHSVSNIRVINFYFSDYCYLEEYVKAGLENNCHEFMGYVMIKALEDLIDRLGSNMVF